MLGFRRNIYLVSFQNALNSASCSAMMAGMPRVNFKWRVLCRNTYIPDKAPMLPPSMADSIRVDSGMRQQFFLALRLSASISRNAAALIRRR